jgi:hypothetical protein
MMSTFRCFGVRRFIAAFREMVQIAAIAVPWKESGDESPHSKRRSISQIGCILCRALVEWNNGRPKFVCRLMPPRRVTLPIFSYLRQLYLRYFSKPIADRPIYRAIQRHHVLKIVELGIGDCHRALRMIEVARAAAPGEEIQYFGLDLFEGRAEKDGPGLSLKEAHQLLRGTGVRVQLAPGNPADGLIRMANGLGNVDLMIVPAELDSESFARFWFFMPRMLHEKSLVYIDGPADDGQRLLRIKSREEIDRLAAIVQGRRAA